MKVVAITKTYGELDHDCPDFGAIYKSFPGDYPRQCIEVEAENLEHAQAMYPGREVMTSEAFNEMMRPLHVAHASSIDALYNKQQEVAERERDEAQES